MSVLNLARAKIAELDNRLSHGTPLGTVPWDSGRRTGARGAHGTVEPHGTDGTFGTTGSDVRPDAAPCPADTFVERAAINANGDDRNLTTADARTPAEIGPRPWSAVAASCSEILARLKVLPPPNNGCESRLLEITRSFLDTKHWQAAVTMGWTEVDLFGVNPAAALLDTSTPTATVHAPTIVDHLQRGQRRQLDQCAHDRMAITRFNDWHARAGTGIKAEPIDKFSNPIDAPTAAVSFVQWAAEHRLARELKVDDLWALVTEDWAPAHKWLLPPRRFFLGALQRVPGVRVHHDRRVYARDGRVSCKTTIYILPHDGKLNAGARSTSQTDPADKREQLMA